MVKTLNKTSNKDPRILLLSQREVRHHYSNCSYYEFEDLIGEVDAVDFVNAQINPTNTAARISQLAKGALKLNAEASSRANYRLAEYTTRLGKLASSVMPSAKQYIVDQEYELFFVIFANPLVIGSLDSIQGFRKNCQKAVCYLVEAWETQVRDFKSLLDPLKQFDHIFVGVHHIVDLVAEITGRPCTYLPLGVDAASFCPYPYLPHRSIDVYSLGRRCSPVTHQALLEMADKDQFFYYYDTVKGSQYFDWKEHRRLITNLAKRSRYFIANSANINTAYKTKGKAEIGGRFFEGAAAGTVMIGDYPNTEVFKEYFNWPDAVIHIPFEASNVADIIADLDAQPERLERIRKDNVSNSLRRNDWVHRWKTILESVGVQPTTEMQSREAYLQSLAKDKVESLG